MIEWRGEGGRLETFPDPTDWLTVRQAARLTGSSARTWRWRAKRAWSQAQDDGRRPLARKASPRSGRGKAVWYVHRSLDPRLSLRQTQVLQARPALSARYPQHVVARALRRNHWLKRWRTLCAEPRDEGETERTLAARIVAEARRVEGERFKISVRSLQRWRWVYQSVDSDGQVRGIEALVDRYASSLVTPNDRAVSGATRDPRSVDYFYGLYHCQNRLSVRLCHQATLRHAQRQRWNWPASYQATLRWLQRYDDRSMTCLVREGKDRWARRYMPYLEIDYATLLPGELYVCDHTRCDFWVTHRDAQIRPWLTAVQDARSRCIVGWHLGPAAHQDAIVAALRMAFGEWAIPETMRIDNGRDFTSKLITGLTRQTRDRLRRQFGRDWYNIVRRNDDLVPCDDLRWLGITGELGIELIYATPYAPWAKGTLERWFGTFQGQCSKTFATYCGNSALTKPECLEEIRQGYGEAEKQRLRQLHGRDWKRLAVLRVVDDVPLLEEARERVAEYIDIYHRTEHGGRGMRGQAPLAVWHGATHLRRAAEDDLLFLMDGRGIYRVGASGIRLTVGGASIGYGASDPALRRWLGRSVFIALDPSNVGQCHAFTPDRRKRHFIATLRANKAIPPRTTVDEAREAIATIQRDRAVMRRAALTASHRTRGLEQRLREFRTAQAADLRTDVEEAASGSIILPVRTGFEGVSKPDRGTVEAYRPVDPGELGDLYEIESDSADDLNDLEELL